MRQVSQGLEMVAEMRLAGICKDCMKRLGVDERLTIPLQFVQISQLPEFDPKSLAGVHFPGASQAYGLGRAGLAHGTTKITYKIAKTVKESIDDAASHTSQSSHRGQPPSEH